MRIATLAASVFLLLAACGGSDSYESKEVPFIRVDGQWVFAGVNKTFVIRDYDEWAALWSMYAWKSESGQTITPLPSVNGTYFAR